MMHLKDPAYRTSITYSVLFARHTEVFRSVLAMRSLDALCLDGSSTSRTAATFHISWLSAAYLLAWRLTTSRIADHVVQLLLQPKRYLLMQAH
eukprot:1161336-Pelagomonas_calceolata.AAC.2